MSPQNLQIESVDYTGAPLRVGQNITFIEDDQERSGQPRLYTGELKLIGTEQLVVESGRKLFIVRGREESQPRRAYRFATVFGMQSPDSVQQDRPGERA